jgi:hypothetical protein
VRGLTQSRCGGNGVIFECAKKSLPSRRTASLAHVSNFDDPITSAPPIGRRVFKPAIAQEGGFEVRNLGAQVLSDLSPVDRGAAAEQRGFTLKLASIQDLRSAIVLREIFGPPRSLQALDPISSF